jgi:formamidopyrimidine-DNA glycosylase
MAMIELPEAVVLANQVNRTLTGKRMIKASANQSPHKFAWYTGDPGEYHAWLAGKTISGAANCGGHIEINAGDMLLVLSAPLRYHPPGEKLPARHQLLLEFEDQSALSLTIQMWGGIFCFPAGEEGGMADYQIARQRPSPIAPGFDRAHFDGLFNADTPKLSAKAFLATEQRVPGLGNGVLQDILWTARIHPRRKMGELSASENQAVFKAVISVLRAMTECGGRDTERDLFGNPGGYRTILSKNTAGKACPECGSAIQKEPYMGGSIYFCPGCQSIS